MTQAQTFKHPESVLVVMYATNGQFLLIERADKAGWQSVTGSLDTLHEPPIQAAQRELYEETGVQAFVDFTEAFSLSQATRGQLSRVHHVRAWPFQCRYEIFPRWRHRYAPEVTHNVEHWFYVCLPVGHQPILAPQEHIQFAWFDAQEAQARCFSPNNAQAIAELAAQLHTQGLASNH